MVVPLAFWHLLILLHAYLTENILEKKLLCPQINLKIENVYFNVKLRENNVIGPYLILLGTVAATQIQPMWGRGSYVPRPSTDSMPEEAS